MSASTSFIFKLPPFLRSFVITICALSIFGTLFITYIHTISDNPFQFEDLNDDYSVSLKDLLQSTGIIRKDPSFSSQHPPSRHLLIDPKFAALDRIHLNINSGSPQSSESNQIDQFDEASETSSDIPSANTDSYDLSNSNSSSTHQYAYKNAAVSCDVPICSQLGSDILRRGGSAVDAAITVCLCLGSINSFSSGIGGGGFMVARVPSSSHNQNSPEALTINFREKAPGAADKNMYKNNPSLSKIGGLAVGIPGEIEGLYQAYTRFTSGKLTWAQLIEPVAELNEKGFEISLPLANAISIAESVLLQYPDQWGWLLTNSTTPPPTSTKTSTESGIATDSVPNPTNGASDLSKLRVKKLGEHVTRPLYAKTLRQIAKNGSSAVFYDPKGPIAPHLVHTIQSSGGIATVQDFAKYNAEVSQPLISNFRGRTIYTSRNPSSGPVLQFGLNVLNSYPENSGSSESTDIDFGSISTQRLVETMKFMGAARSELGDPTSETNNSIRINNLANVSYAHAIRTNISDTKTYPWQYYSPAYEANDPHGTTHFSVIDANGGAVALTTTVNLFFGSLLCDNTTGIILNNQMDDFSVPNTSNSFGLQASIYNFVAPHKRPVSSISPAIIVYPKGRSIGKSSSSDKDNKTTSEIEMVIGASGGSHITTTVIEEIVRKLDYNLSLVDTIQRPRIHHQLLPDIAQVENGWPQSSVDSLKSKGHDVQFIGSASVSNGLYRNLQDGIIIAVADWWRKRGQPAGY